MPAEDDLLRILAASPVRTSELVRMGFSRNHVARMVASGTIAHMARGLYGLPGELPREHHSLILATLQAPKAVICLLSALRFHGLTTQVPREIWMALEGRAHRPKVTGILVNFHRFTADAFHEGIEVHSVSGADLRVYGVTKTVLDCFRMRSKIGLDVALEALRDSLRQRKTTLGDLDRLARRLHIHSVVKPYLEMEAAT